MNSIISIGRAAFAALALALVAVACDDDASPTKLADDNREPPEATAVNPWTQILAAAETLGGPVKVSFAGSDRSYRVRGLEGESALSQNGEDMPAAICTVADTANRADLDAFRQCMALALRADVCRNGGVFVLYRPNLDVPNSWRATCPAPEREDDDPEDEDSRANDLA